MSGRQVRRTRNGGRIVYNKQPSYASLYCPTLFQHIRPRYCRPSRITVSEVPSNEHPARRKPEIRIVAKLAGSREQTFRFLRSVIAQHSASPKTEIGQPTPDGRKNSRTHNESASEAMPATGFLRGGARGQMAASSPLSRPALQEMSRTDSTSSNASAKAIRSNMAGSAAAEKPVASGNGVSVSINLAEPVLFLQGYDQNDSESRSTAMLRGSLHLHVQKSAKIKAVSLKFKGTATTRWPEGIPPKKVEFEETDTLMSHTWPFFNAQFPNAEGGSCADRVELAASNTHGTPYMNGSPVGSHINVNLRDQKRLSLQVQSRSFDKAEAKPTASVAQRGYRTFHPGDYFYNFELPLDSRLPETVDVDLGFVKYELEATVERTGAFRANLFGHKDVTLIRAPTEGSLEQIEPIAISRTWEDQLHYDIVISGKSFPLGSKVPIAFKLTPLAKVQLHRIKVFVTENTEYFCSGKRVHRMEPTKKVLLFEKRADGTNVSTFPGSTQRITAGGGIPYTQREAAARGENVTPQDPSNLLGRLENEPSVGPTEMEFSVQLPGCQHPPDKERMNKLHFDTTHQNIQIHHWIKIVLRLSKPDAVDPTKRRHFEISIDSPFHILSCRANQANIALPAYSSPESTPLATQSQAHCGCPGAPRRRMSPTYMPTLNAINSRQSSVDSNAELESPSSTTSGSESSAASTGPATPGLAPPPQAHITDHMVNGHVQRPMHILRTPSFNPPAFEAEEPPPPLVTPPPQYNDIASPTAGHGLADYFSRFESTYGEEESDSGEEDRNSIRGRVNLPLTPGGRVNRSMDLGRREWTDLSAGGR